MKLESKIHLKFFSEVEVIVFRVYFVYMYMSWLRIVTPGLPGVFCLCLFVLFVPFFQGFISRANAATSGRTYESLGFECRHLVGQVCVLPFPIPWFLYLDAALQQLAL